MTALITPIALIGAAWLAHLVWWRIRLPEFQIRALVIVFAVVPVVACVVWLALAPAAGPSTEEMPAVLLLYGSAAACYLIVYTGIEETSPTLLIVRHIARAQDRGCSSEELADVISQGKLLFPRLLALERDGLITRVSGGWALTARGRRAAQTAQILARSFAIRGGG